MTATVLIKMGLWIWNDFFLPLLVLNKSTKYWTLTLFQYNFKSTFTVDYALVFATFHPVHASGIPGVPGPAETDHWRADQRGG